MPTTFKRPRQVFDHCVNKYHKIIFEDLFNCHGCISLFTRASEAPSTHVAALLPNRTSQDDTFLKAAALG
jgi:hypothetical protein